jgi:uncharacterized membrane protein YbhN (UPF0104 family)
MRVRLPQSRWLRGGLLLGSLAVVIVVLWWRGPEWGLVADVFGAVTWRWVVLALVLNLLSVVARAFAWQTVVAQALPNERIGFGRVFSAFGVGLLANAVLPARTGELARVAVLTRRLPRGRGYTATLLGTVFTHRVFDVPPVLLLVVYVVLTAKVPHWALTSLVIAAAVGVAMLGAALLGSRLRRPVLDGMHPVRRVLAMARIGLDVLRSPLAAAIAIFFQCIGWALQLLAVYTSMRGFGIHAPMPAAALVLLLMNVALIFPLWPGNVGLLQAAVALPLRQYGVPYARGFAYGIGLQVIEMSVGVGVGLIFLAREGLSFATLKRMEQEEEQAVVELVEEAEPARGRKQMVGS